MPALETASKKIPRGGLKVPFGSRAGTLVAPTEVHEKGLDCCCICPGCGSPLVLKHGAMRPHFAHYRASGTDHCVESAIHAAAKQVLVARGCLVVPELILRLSAATDDGGAVFDQEVLSPVRRIRFDRTEPEVLLEGVRPDVVGYRAGRMMLVEMYFRHRVDEEKRHKLKELGWAALEIDLSDLDPLGGFAAVEERVIEDTAHKEWLHYPRRDAHLAHVQHRLQERVASANAAHRAALAQARAERAQLAQQDRAAKAANFSEDIAFSRLDARRQAEWLRDRLNLPAEIPELLSRAAYPAEVHTVPGFLYQGSIVERFLFNAEVWTKVSAWQIFPCLRRRFQLSSEDDALHRLAINLYLHALACRGFLSESGGGLTGPYMVKRPLLLVDPGAVHAAGEGVSATSAGRVGGAATMHWRDVWPRWRNVMDNAGSVLELSPYRDALLEAVGNLSALTPPASPHDWADELEARGVPAGDCLGLLKTLGLVG